MYEVLRSKTARDDYEKCLNYLQILRRYLFFPRQRAHRGARNEKQKMPFMTLNGDDNNEGRGDIVAARSASLSRAIPDQLYVYTDICEPYTVGNTQAALLRIVSMDTSKFRYGCNAVQRFAPAHYIPLLYLNFNNVIIDIRDQHGQRIQFKYGSFTVTLYFRRNQ